MLNEHVNGNGISIPRDIAQCIISALPGQRDFRPPNSPGRLTHTSSQGVRNPVSKAVSHAPEAILSFSSYFHVVIVISEDATDADTVD